MLDPAPIPDQELQRTFEWLRSWDMMGETLVAEELVNMETQEAAHQLV